MIYLIVTESNHFKKIHKLTDIKIIYNILFVYLDKYGIKVVVIHIAWLLHFENNLTLTRNKHFVVGSFKVLKCITQITYSDILSNVDDPKIHIFQNVFIIQPI